MASAANASVKTYEQWSEKFGKISDRFSDFFKENTLSDVIFICGRNPVERVQAHKFVLIACSWQLFVAFTLIKLDDEVISVPDVTVDTLMCFLEFCYKGKVELAGRDAWDILKLAYRFDVKQLIELCEVFLIEDLSVNTCLDFYVRDTFLPENSTVKKRILEKIESEFATITRNEEALKSFVMLPMQKLHDIAKSENLKCDEILLFESMMKWARHACEEANLPSVPKNLRKKLDKVFYEIRFPIMKMGWIFGIQANYPEILSPKEISHIAKFMMKKESSCSDFKTSSRNGNLQLQASSNITISFCPKFVRSSRTFRVHGYTEENTRNAGITAFNCETPMTLIGFGYYRKKDTECEIKRCDLNETSLTVMPFKEMRTFLFNRINSRIETVDCHYVYFTEKQNIIPNKWYELSCEFTKNVVAICAKNDDIYYDEDYKIKFKNFFHRVGIFYLLFE